MNWASDDTRTKLTLMAVFKLVRPSMVKYGSSTLMTVVVCHLKNKQ